jgi:hypothetical protein
VVRSTSSHFRFRCIAFRTSLFNSGSTAAERTAEFERIILECKHNWALRLPFTVADPTIVHFVFKVPFTPKDPDGRTLQTSMIPNVDVTGIEKVVAKILALDTGAGEDKLPRSLLYKVCIR